MVSQVEVEALMKLRVEAIGRERVKGLKDELNKLGVQISDNRKESKQQVEALKDNDQVMNRLQRRMRPFRMEMLSILFAGMQLAKTFGSINQAGRQAFGTFDILGQAAMLATRGWTIEEAKASAGVLEFIANLSDSETKMIGMGAAFLEVLGYVGQFGAEMFLVAGSLAIMGTSLGAVAAGIGIVAAGFAALIFLADALNAIAPGFTDPAMATSTGQQLGGIPIVGKTAGFLAGAGEILGSGPAGSFVKNFNTTVNMLGSGMSGNPVMLGAGIGAGIAGAVR